MKLRSAAGALMFLAVSAFAATEGKPGSPVRVVVYEDLQCPDCAAYRKMIDEHLLPKYGDRVAFEHRDFPLTRHKWARPAAIAARHFDSVNGALGIEFRRWAMNNIASLTADNFEVKMAGWAKSHGADPGKAVAALRNEAIAKAVEEDYQDGVARGVARTPTVFVNGQPFIERFTAEEISKGIDAALAAAAK
jgi:protein-disulfide isomerase